VFLTTCSHVPLVSLEFFSCVALECITNEMIQNWLVICIGWYKNDSQPILIIKVSQYRLSSISAPLINSMNKICTFVIHLLWHQALAMTKMFLAMFISVCWLQWFGICTSGDEAFHSVHFVMISAGVSRVSYVVS